MDYNKHAHGRYQVCQEGDRLDFGTFVPSRWEVPLAEIKDLFSSNKNTLPSCLEKPIVEVSQWLANLILQSRTLA